MEPEIHIFRPVEMASVYTGSSERVCLITGSPESIVRAHDFIMKKILEKPDPTAKAAIDYDHKFAAQREKQVIW